MDNTAIATAPRKLYIEISFLVLLSLIWGSSFTWTKVAVGTIPPLTVTAIRVTAAALILFTIGRFRGYQMPKDAKIWGEFLSQGVLQSALPFALLGWGAMFLPSGLTGVLNVTPPMFVLLISAVTGFGANNLTPQKAIGVMLGLGGVIVIIGVNALQDISTAAPLAQIAVLGASVCYAVAALLGRRFSALPPLVSATGSMTCAAVIMVPAALLFERPWTLQPSLEAIIAVSVLACLCTAFAMVLYFRLVKTLGSLGTSSGGYLRAGFAVALGIIFLGERFDWSTFVGMVVIVVGVVAVTVPINRARFRRS